MATADYTFFTYGDVDGMYGMLNGVVMIMGSTGYESIVRLMVMLGAIMMTLYMAGVSVHAHRGWKWLVTVAIISSALFGPKSTVAIEDATGLQSPAVVEKVPTALAFFFGIKSAVGQKLTELADTAFQTLPPAPMNGQPAAPNFAMPADLAYTKSGMMFGPRVIEATRSAQIIDPVLRADLANYIKDCVIPSVNNLISPVELSISTNLWQTIKNTNKAFYTHLYVPQAKDYAYMTCDDAWTTLDGELGDATTAITKRLGAMMFPNAPSTNDAMMRIQSGVLAAYGKAQIGSAAADANAIILQNAVINTMTDAAGSNAAQLGDMSSIMQAFAKQQSSAQVNASLIAQGETVGAALPMAKNILDMIMIAAFPVVCLLLIATEGEMLRTLGQKYIMAMIWTELWPFFYAVVSFIGSNYAAHRAAQMGMLPDGSNGMAMITADAIYSGTISDLAMVGWAMSLVPVISGALVFGFDRMVTTSSGLSTMGAQAGANAGNAAVGNASGGVVSMDKYDLAYAKTDPNMMRYESVDGTTYKNAGSPYDPAGSRWETRMGSSPVSLDSARQLTEQYSRRSSESLSAADASLAKASTSIHAARSQALELATQRGDTYAVDRLSGNNWDASTSLSTAQSTEVTDELMKRLGISASTENGRELRQQLQTQMRTGLDAGVLAASLSHTLTSGGVNVSKEQMSNAVDSAVKTAQSMRMGNEAREVNAVTTGIRVSDQDTRSKALRESVGASLNEAQGYTKDASLSLTRAKEFSETAELGKSTTARMGFNYVRAFNEFAAWRTGRDPSTISDRDLQDLQVQFFRSQVVMASDDNGPFAAPKVFGDITDHGLTGSKVTDAGQFGGNVLPQARDDALKKRDLVGETAIPKGDGERQEVLKKNAGDRGAVVSSARAVGAPTSTTGAPKAPENVLPLPPANQSKPSVGPVAPGSYLPEPGQIAGSAQAGAQQVGRAAEGTREQFTQTRDGAIAARIGEDRNRMWTPTPTSTEPPKVTPKPEQGNKPSDGGGDTYEDRVNRIPKP